MAPALTMGACDGRPEADGHGRDTGAEARDAGRHQRPDAGPEAAAEPCAARLRDVRFSYDGGHSWALDGIDLTVGATERLCLLGANGSGKSTLAGLLAGIEAPDAGTVELWGRTCFSDGAPDGTAYARARRRCGLVLQVPEDQIVTTVVAEDVAFGPENLGFSPQKIDQVVARELHRVGLEALADADPTRLSGGQQQRVAIAGALAMEPDLLVLDEPGARLDVRGRRGLMRVLAGLQGTRALVHVTHFMEEALPADRVVVLHRGRVAMEGAPAEVLCRAEELAALGLEPPFPVRLSLALRRRGLDVFAVEKGDLLRQLAELAPGRAPRVGGAR